MKMLSSFTHPQVVSNLYEFFTFINLADHFFQSDLQLRNTKSDTLQRGKKSQEVLVIQHFRHCFVQKLARPGEVKEREQRCFLWRGRSRIQVKTEEMSFQVSLENCQGLSLRGRKFIPPARNGEWKRSGEWFCASLGWHHEASLARRSQTSGGDVDWH